MHPKQIIGVARVGYRTLMDVSPPTLAIYTRNYFGDIVRRRFSFDDSVQPKMMGLEITDYCDQNCRGCYVPRERRSDRRTMDESLMISAISQAKDLGIRQIGFFGGELISEEALPLSLIALSSEPRLSFAYCTNGKYIAESDISFFRGYPNASFCVGLDGLRETHERNKGRGTYDRTMEAIRKLRNLKRLFSVYVTARNDNIDEVLSPDFADHLAQSGVKYVMLGRYTNPGDRASEVPDAEFLKRLRKLRGETMTKPVHFNADLVFSFLFFDHRLAFHTAYVGVDGDVRIEREDRTATGNLGETSMREIFESSSQEYRSKYSLGPA
jgi:MoaA/NifB/PqqE/SkfB family radical SAM enzyme